METVLIIEQAVLAAFTVLWLTASGNREALAAKTKSRKINKMLNCDFCISFWVNVICSAVLFLLSRDAEVAVYPFLATPITRVLL